MNENYKQNKSIGTEKRGNLEYIERAKSEKKTEMNCTPDSVLTAAAATAGALVGKGNVCRVFGVAGSSLVAFGPSGLALPTTTTQNAAMLSLTCQIFVANDDFIRTTSDVIRVEVVLD